MYNLNNPVKQATREGFGKAISELAEKDNKIIALSAGVGDSTMAHKLKAKTPGQYIEAGISEQAMIGLSAGLALAGKIPFPTSFATFLPGRCYDQIRQSVCYSNLNVKLVATHAGLSVGADGATHQMMEDIAMLRATPNIKIIVPCDALEAERAVKAAAYENGPFYIRLGREKTPVFTSANTPFVIGKAVTLREGDDASIIASGLMVYYSLLASEALAKENIRVRVINMHTIKPLDAEAVLRAAKETGAIVTAEEHQINGGLGGAVCETLCETFPAPVVRIGMKDSFGESGNAADLFRKYKMAEADIASAVREALKKKK